MVDIKNNPRQDYLRKAIFGGSEMTDGLEDVYEINPIAHKIAFLIFFFIIVLN